jgi:hypothetical protein
MCKNIVELVADDVDMFVDPDKVELHGQDDIVITIENEGILSLQTKDLLFKKLRERV